jgi:hypothetical protein
MVMPVTSNVFRGMAVPQVPTPAGRRQEDHHGEKDYGSSGNVHRITLKSYLILP